MHTEARKYSYSFVPNCKDWLKKRTYQRKNYHFFLKWEGELEINLRIKQKKVNMNTIISTSKSNKETTIHLQL